VLHVSSVLFGTCLYAGTFKFVMSVPPEQAVAPELAPAPEPVVALPSITGEEFDNHMLEPDVG
jgi:hypothetical protein